MTDWVKIVEIICSLFGSCLFLYFVYKVCILSGSSKNKRVVIQPIISGPLLYETEEPTYLNSGKSKNLEVGNDKTTSEL
jgi:hypothetical protein